MNAGTDCTDEFAAIHSRKAWAHLDQYAIGTLAQGDGDAVAAADDASSKITLKKKARVKLTLSKRIQLSSDSFRLRFALPSPEHVLGLPIGQHVLIYGKDVTGRMVARAYTPATADEVKGHVDRPSGNGLRDARRSFERTPLAVRRRKNHRRRSSSR